MNEPADAAERKARRLQIQRERRQRSRRIDYQPCPAVRMILGARMATSTDGYSREIDRLVLRGAGLPEASRSLK